MYTGSRLNKKLANAGITISATSNEANIANTIEIAIGWNSFPSTPSRAKSGANTTTIIITAKKTGLAISFAASWIRSRIPSVRCDGDSAMLLSSIGFSSACTGSGRVRCEKIFSIITTEPSTIIPIAIARPPSDIRLAETPQYAMTVSARPIESGIEIKTSTVARKFIRNTNSTMTIRTNACSSAVETVLTALLIKSA